MESERDWRRRVDAIMKKNYAITTDDAGLSEDDILRFFRNEPDADAFVDWFATKHDLVHASSWL